jgi:hypothetical protein
MCPREPSQWQVLERERSPFTEGCCLPNDRDSFPLNEMDVGFLRLMTEPKVLVVL